MADDGSYRLESYQGRSRMREGHLSARGVALQVGIWAGLVIACAFVVNLSLLGIQSGFFQSSPVADNSTQQGHIDAQFALDVAQNGETVYTAVESGAYVVTEELRDELLGTTYPSPELATTAATGEEVSGNAAYAHAVNICTHDRGGKASRNTGASRHLTRFTGHYNRRHHTKTIHQLMQAGYPVTGTFRYSVRRGYCGCG